MRARSAGAGGRGEQAKGQTAACVRQRGFDEAALRGDKSPTDAIKNHPAVAVYAAVPRQGHFFEPVPPLLVDPPPVSRQHTAIRRLAEAYHYFVGKTLGRPETLKLLAVKPEQPVFSARPQKPRPILEENFYRQVGEAILGSVVAKTVLLGPYRRSQGEA